MLDDKISRVYFLHLGTDLQKQRKLKLYIASFLLQTLWFMEQLLDYSRIVGEVLQGQSSFAVSSTDAERNKALGKFLSKCTLLLLDVVNLSKV